MMKLLAQVFLVSIMFCSWGYGRILYEDFEGYEAGQSTGDFYFYTDTTTAGYGVNIHYFEEHDINAAFFNLNSENLTPNDWIHFETYDRIEDGPTADWMQYHLAVAPTSAVADANPTNPSLINEVWYYIYADTTGDGFDDTYYESRVTGFGDPGSPLNNYDILQAYPRLFFDGDDTWDEYDIGDWSFLDSTNQIPVEVLDSLTAVGVQFRTEDFDPDGESELMTIFADNAFLIPEPSMFMLLLGACGLLFVYRGRRGPQA